MMNISEQIVVITGAAGALGSVVTACFANSGSQLVLIDFNQQALQQFAKTLEVTMPPLCLRADLTSSDSVKDAFTEIKDKFSTVDVLVNIAGGFAMGSRLHQTELSEWDRMLDMNARSVFLTSRAAIPLMLETNSGKIINIAARVAIEAKQKMAAYSVSKTAVAKLTECMAAEYRHDGINVNAIMPGTIDTAANRADMPDADYSQWVKPQQLANVIEFLSSDQADAINGAVIPVFGLT